MHIKSAIYTGSRLNLSELPAPGMPEYAFIGRSNVGKSSLINMLTGFNNLAKTSNTPGKTQLINHFLINDSFYFADLPGYGYAKIPRSLRKQWDVLMRKYFTQRPNLQCVFTLIDSRLPPQKPDIEFINWLGKLSVPFVLIFTKVDKQSKPVTLANISRFRKELFDNWEFLPEIFVSSSITGAGKDELLNFIERINGEFELPDKPE